mmetsp:Transcript_11390/g.10897  ORF Transcript_11390/g.10897 Transcript_11390/m.10897 type:complete len:420 (-) Transcript_11390:262-1521(-)|eukprot:CAMPEP_0197831776 /NCGR_PEP_ID=MMETSP1437-20131217/12077_1 /TAXON_ID=49252 ORGANISM="Eucampia antarctica, Strain CCMP1452" /NCGR_SAMPLE_ID=MMETSP1437 /ASSEMBLY_ACC=CAM_ASM_001096 /LENGTH=419 /DNA_ID=CAMNT_0043434843 /DNA_START=229 /DNA_END=1488 /DNA_ORIENTATION=-
MQNSRCESLSNLAADYIYVSTGDLAAFDVADAQPQSPPLADTSDDEKSGGVDREYTGVFEGPEKTLEVCFRRKDGSEPVPDGEKAGLRLIDRHNLDTICTKARCTILSSVSNDSLDAYVLSESSLFVYNYMIILKTCGTTTLLRCLAVLIEAARRLDLTLDWVGYSRKNFNFPEDQCFPHGSFNQELKYLFDHRNLSNKLDGHGYTLGPVTDDHWFVFVADKTIRSQVEDLHNDRVLNIMMFDFDMDVAACFYYDKYKQRISEDETEDESVRRISFEQTKASGIDLLYPEATFDPRAFEPCGYSMNAIKEHSYCTMHITPEEGSSYASFETNQKILDYASVINDVVRTFRPKRFVITLIADDGGVRELESNILDCAASSARVNIPANDKNPAQTYKRNNSASITVEEDTVCMMGNWILT